MSRRSTGMVLGKFMPPHLGHKYLVDFAARYVDELTVIVGTLRSEPIPGEKRYSWMREMFPNARVVHLTDENPQYPEEHPGFWRIWHDSIRKFIPNGPDYVFASESYGWKLAEILGARFVPVDIARGLVQVSGTAVRNDPIGNWDYLPACVRPYFLKRVCVFGPESTGKSSLAAKLADHFGTKLVSEYARAHLEAAGGRCSLGDMEPIARGQAASEDALALQARRVLICDTDLLTTRIWSEALYGECSQWICEASEERHYDLYLLTDIDVPWVADSVRYLPEKRAEFLERCERALIEQGRSYLKISGGWERRFETARAAVESLLRP